MDEGFSIAGLLAAAVAALVALFLIIAAGAWLFSIKGTDSGQVCVVREGGPFDGRAIIDVRQPGSGAKPIGMFNHQSCLPVTERDSNDIVDPDQTFPTKDSVQVLADGQALFTLTSDPTKIKGFYTKFGRRKWLGKDISTDEGWKNFLKVRVAPILTDAQRQVIGQYNCTSLNNLCQYVQNAENVAKGNVEKVDNTQNLAAAQQSIVTALKAKLRTGLGGDYFDNVRYQNLRIRFESGVQERINDAQALRTEAANAKLEADKKVAEANGAAAVKVAEADGARRAADEQEKAYRSNPTQRKIDQIKAFCGPDGCDPKYIGGSLNSIIANLSK